MGLMLANGDASDPREVDRGIKEMMAYLDNPPINVLDVAQGIRMNRQRHPSPGLDAAVLPFAGRIGTSFIIPTRDIPRLYNPES